MANGKPLTDRERLRSLLAVCRQALFIDFEASLDDVDLAPELLDMILTAAQEITGSITFDIDGTDTFDFRETA